MSSPTHSLASALRVAVTLCGCCCALAATAGVARAQRAAAAARHPASLVGSWRGTSICRPVGKPACHDEVVVHHLRPDTALAAAARATGVERLQWVMNKVVNGAEEEMGTMSCEYRASTGVATCPMRGWTWSFEATAGDSLAGTLANPAGVVWRDLRLARVSEGGPRDE